jgi:AraC family ethanolamine operon transcriptional activator
MVHRQIEGGVFKGELIAAQFAGMQFARLTYNRGIRSSGNSPAGTIAIAIPLSIPQSLHWHGHSLSIDQAILQKSSHGIDFLRKGIFELALAVIEIKALLDAADLTAQPGVESLLLGDAYLVQPNPIALKRFRCHLQNLFKLIQEQPQQLLHPHRQSLIRQDSILLMLDILNANPKSRSPRPLTRYQLMKKAEAILIENLHRPLTIYELCSQLHVSERTLHYGFQEYFGISPMAYFKAQRLNGVRLQLKASSSTETTVADIAAQWGFWHMGQFAKDYKQMFCESPSETLRKD